MPDNQPFSSKNRIISTATSADLREITHFLSQNYRIHQHLDWFNALEWIGQQPFLVEKYQQQIYAILLTAPEVPGATWIRLFCIKNSGMLEPTWQRLLDHAILSIKSMGVKTLAALGSSRWFTTLLSGTKFEQTNNIVSLEKKYSSMSVSNDPSQIEIRPMCGDDLPEVAQIDHAAFAPIWQNSLASLKKAYQQQGVATVAVRNQKIVGYQISTWWSFHAHLARLAVQPEQQGQHIASMLVGDLLTRLLAKEITHVTVNTQADNHSSLAVYSKFGFQQTGTVIPVYQRAL